MTDAEQLIDIAEAIIHPHDQILISEDNPPYTADTVALALRLRKNTGICLRAMMEEWDRFRIVKELY